MNIDVQQVVVKKVVIELSEEEADEMCCSIHSLAQFRNNLRVMTGWSNPYGNKDR